MTIRDYVKNRIFQTIVTIFATFIINFIIFRMMPGDPVRIMIRDPRIGTAEINRLRAEFGLDKPLYMQFIMYISNIFRGNLGISFVHRTPVVDVIVDRLFDTLLLGISATVLAILSGVLIGVLSAWKHGTKVDAASLGFSLITWSTPTFWLAALMIMVFSVNLGIFPTSRAVTIGAVYGTFWDELADRLHHIFLPMITFALVLLGQYSLLVRSTMLDVLTEDYILTAKSKGLGEVEVLRKHALKNAMLPTTSAIAINLGLVISGMINIETVFAWPGIGRLLFDSVLMLDYPVMQGIFIFTAITVIIANFLADMVIAYFDPRIRY